MTFPSVAPAGFGIAILAGFLGIWLYWQDYVSLWTTRRISKNGLPGVLLPVMLLLSVIGLGAFIINEVQDPVVAYNQIEEVKSLYSFVGGLDEMELRERFDLINLENLNISHLAKCDLNYLQKLSGGCDYSMYLSNGWSISMKSSSRVQEVPSGYHTAWNPNWNDLVILTPQFNSAQKTLFEFYSSNLLPKPVRKKVKALYDALNKNIEILNNVFDEGAQESPKYFIYANVAPSAYYGVLNARFCDRLIQLKPKADDVIRSIRAHWNI